MLIPVIGDILFGVPAMLGKQVIEGLRQEIDRECLVSEGSIKLRLQQLQLMLQDGEMAEEEYDRLEADLIERLRAVRKQRE